MLQAQGTAWSTTRPSEGRAADTHDQDGHEARQRGVPVPTGRGRGLSHEHAVEDEVSQPQLHTSWEHRETPQSGWGPPQPSHPPLPQRTLVTSPPRARPHIYPRCLNTRDMTPELA